jgi:hypothetical protein
MTRSASSDAVEVHEDPLADRDADSEGEGDSGGEQADVPELERQALERELANGLPDDDDVVVKTAAYVPADWQPAAPKTNLGEKDFSDVDNPGAWHEFAYRPKFEGKGAARKYVGHAMPAGAMPVPLGEGGTRELAGWLFNYDGWEAPQAATKYRTIPIKESSIEPSDVTKLDVTMLIEYDPVHLKYPGDELFRAVTSVPKRKRSVAAATVGSEEAWASAPEHRKLGHFGVLADHQDSLEKKTNSKKCAVCKKPSYWRCSKCDSAAVCAPWGVGHSTCFLKHHDTGYLGLGFGDATSMGGGSKGWKAPTKGAEKAHRATCTSYGL